MGPTASGKTGLSLTLAEHLPVEIISVDSAQVYRGMDIGSAKPDAATLARVPHHLIDLLDPSEAYSAARFRDDALLLIAAIRERGNIPLLVGGTMLYYRALQYGLSDLPAADPALRTRIEARASADGWPALHAELTVKDPVTAARLHPNDQQRIQRALEIIELSGRSPTEFYAQAKTEGLAGKLIKIGLNPASREELHERIALRFHQMMREGFLEEVARLKARGDLNVELPSIRAVGYRQLWEHLEGRDSLENATERGIAATRQFAKRQITWLRSETAVQWLDPASDNLLNDALQLLK
ncbi:tRNA (adenosine(37)-N6)-dimethylallyltransferase MiaA [Stenotrophobium rhamnosiphilum]|uniref:tRNA dimethylallyltransferase n=1 Tax=Stenotrophobium rhamnosiphilum TaxID=2029166 RepID=A0A2T5MEQ7_9GAMM|nr:tRNA (adenosine(37)-N6)-dimethylallyltransferase MiaA [Stenotrophobium rhamnosiphilum]PTU31054.1 tRNA (adenosine(37)-N6)-dimethylallyltransferase MiaA [Stenotrophobium rhamnosiphilum]